MVKNHAPEPLLTPDAAIRNVVDSTVHMQNVANEDRAAKANMIKAVNDLKRSYASGQVPQKGSLNQSQPKTTDHEQRLQKALEKKASLEKYYAQQQNQNVSQSKGRSLGR